MNNNRQRRVAWAVAGITALGVIGIAGCTSMDTAPKGPTVTEQPLLSDHEDKKESQVTYKVETSDGSPVNVNWGPSGSSSQDAAAATPWTKTTPVSGESFEMYSILATTSTNTTVRCTISIDGKVIKTAQAKGEYAMASCIASQ